MTAFLAWSVTVAQILLGFAMVCATFRLVCGPTAQDRVLAFDSLYVNAMLLLLAFGIARPAAPSSRSSADHCIARIIALLGFVSTIALAKFVLRGEIIA